MLFKVTLKASLKAFGINPETWEHSAQDGANWRSPAHKGSKTCEANRTAAAEQQRQAKKARASDTLPHVPVIPCPYCQRTFLALVSPLRTHRQTQPPRPLDD